jgi:hypothetical protein
MINIILLSQTGRLIYDTRNRMPKVDATVIINVLDGNDKRPLLI